MKPASVSVVKLVVSSFFSHIFFLLKMFRVSLGHYLCSKRLQAQTAGAEI